MKKTRIEINHIPALVWGENSDKVYLCVHGKMSSKESAEGIAKIAEQRGYQTISFDLPGHGERQNEDKRCDIWNGIHDLTVIGEYVFTHWKEVSLYACSLGAYFSLNAYYRRDIKKCLFQSPILDMEYLIKQMMVWFEISEERLAREKEIDTPIDIVTWDYYQYVKEHPIQKWDIVTNILFAGRDTLQSLEIVKEFVNKFNCVLTLSENSEHPFMGEGDEEIVEQWLRDNL
ncbi:MAG: alpha/beta hydrolase [Lachnospiraceae bacterium]|nr:alpha/beta hydrolase [Lachnospiraceae bacterium]